MHSLISSAGSFSTGWTVLGTELYRTRRLFHGDHCRTGAKWLFAERGSSCCAVCIRRDSSQPSVQFAPSCNGLLYGYSPCIVLLQADQSVVSEGLLGCQTHDNRAATIVSRDGNGLVTKPTIQ